MAAKKEDKLIPKNFRDKSSNWWLSGKHYHLNEQNEIVLISGGLPDDSEIAFLRDFCKRNGKKYVPREIIRNE